MLELFFFVVVEVLFSLVLDPVPDDIEPLLPALPPAVSDDEPVPELPLVLLPLLPLVSLLPLPIELPDELPGGELVDPVVLPLWASAGLEASMKAAAMMTLSLRMHVSLG